MAGPTATAMLAMMRTTSFPPAVERFAAPAVAATWLGRIAVPATGPSGRAELGCTPGGDLRLALHDGRLISELRVVPSQASIAARIADQQYLPADMRDGIVRMETPLTPGDHTLSLRCDGARLELHVDGVLADEEWPLGAILPAPPGPALADWRAWPAACADHVLAAWHGRELSDPSSSGTFAAPYWRPAGHNTAVGDVMLTAAGDDLHLLWLHDRRGHRSRWFAGAHQFRHAVSSDLRSWRHLPAPLAIRRPWESYGTGAAVVDGNGAWHLFYQVHGERFAEGAGQAGIWAATSADGVAWLEHAARGPGGGDPTVFQAHGRWHLVAWGQRHESEDLRSWRLADPAFLPVGDLPGGIWPGRPAHVAHRPGTTNTIECPCVWTWNGWSYAAMGRDGFWISRDPLGPYWPGVDGMAVAIAPRWNIYDGLFVPMAAVWRGRCLLAGWLRGEQNWGGVLVWRELLQEADGTLAMRWVPELTPEVERWDAMPAPGQAAVTLPEGPWRLRLRLASGGSDLALRFGSAAALVIEPSANRVRWATPAGAGLPPRNPAEPSFHGREVVIEAVEGLDQPLELEVLAWRDRDGWVLDACLGGRRTLVCYRPHLEAQLALAAPAGHAIISDMRVGRLRRSA